MTYAIDSTHDVAATSWLACANGHADFPLQNLPFGVFSDIRGDGHDRRGGVAIGDFILDLSEVLRVGLLSGVAREAATQAAAEALNAFFAMGGGHRRELRASLFDLLRAPGGQVPEDVRRRILRPSSECRMHLPAEIGDYTDFYAGIHHATNSGVRMGRTPPLARNYKHLPIAYHGRSSSVFVSGRNVPRPSGQFLPPNADEPVFGLSQKLDFELELGMWIGPGNPSGFPIGIAQAHQHIAGYCLLNDLSARDIQAWEMLPLGPFLSKNFGTILSPWVVTPEALAPYRRGAMRREEGDPSLLPYLVDVTDRECGSLSIALEVSLASRCMREADIEPKVITRTDTAELYWTPAQMVAHHTCGGCNLRPGDLFGSGTISSPTPEGTGSLSEIALDGKRPITLPSGESRTYLEDHDELHITARASRSGFATVGFGENVVRILPTTSKSERMQG